ncbi:MAG: hypothetical protein AB7I01_18505 [Gammaproteobacteria bacterium]
MGRTSMKPRATALLLALVVGCGLSLAAEARSSKTPDAYQALLKESLEKKFGLTFYLNGATVPGVVTNIGDDGYVEVRNQEHGRIIIRMDRVDAIAH